MKEDLSTIYNRKGYISVPDVFTSADIERLRLECTRIFNIPKLIHKNNLRTGLRKHINGSSIIDRLDPVRDLSLLFTSLTEDKRLLDLVRQVLKDEPRLLKDKVITKPPGTYGYNMHQDYPYWEPITIPPGDLVNVVVTLDASDERSGATEFVPNCHRKRFPYLKNPGDIDETTLDLGAAEMLTTKPGDVILFHPMTPHRSAVNQSTDYRRQLYLTYYRAKHGDRYEAYYELKRKQILAERFSHDEVDKAFFK